MLTYVLHFDTYLLYLVGALTILLILISGSILRPFHFRPAYYWACFALWTILAVPFSIWRGGSFTLVLGYCRTDFAMLFAVAAVIDTWEECKIFLRVLALSCTTLLVIITFFRQIDEGGRLNLKFSTYANSNDYPAHLLSLMPALLWFAFVTKSMFLRVAALAALAYGLYVILAGSSRGALIALIVGFFYFLFSASKKQRLMALGFATLIFGLALAFLSQNAIRRLFSFSETNASPSSEAVESQEGRTRLLKDSILYALENPVFGLGPGTFEVAEGKAKREWLGAHNTYTEIASECGFPALLFVLCGIGSSYALLRRVERGLKKDVSAKEFLQATFCMQLTLVLVCSVIFFLNFAFSFHLPMVAGIATAMGYGGEDWKKRTHAEESAHASHSPAWRVVQPC
jgi:O-antigen ligase